MIKIYLLQKPFSIIEKFKNRIFLKGTIKTRLKMDKNLNEEDEFFDEAIDDLDLDG